jgi:hypothetical protein
MGLMSHVARGGGPILVGAAGLIWVWADPAQEETGFSWKPSHAARWVLQVARDAEFKEMVVNDDTITKFWCDVKGLTEGRYYWRVAAVSEKDEQGPFTDAWTFTVTTEEAWKRSHPDREPLSSEPRLP